MMTITESKCPFHHKVEEPTKDEVLEAVGSHLVQQFEVIREREVNRFQKSMEEEEKLKAELITKRFIERIASLPLEQIAGQDEESKYESIKQLEEVFRFDCPYFKK